MFLEFIFGLVRREAKSKRNTLFVCGGTRPLCLLLGLTQVSNGMSWISHGHKGRENVFVP